MLRVYHVRMNTIVLIGYRGVGKSLIGRLLAKALDLPFVDSDREILHFAKKPSVESIWNEGGEQAWRALEEEVIVKLLPKGGVIALGGGAPLVPAIREALNGRGDVLYLSAPLKILQERLEDIDRPSLSRGDAEMLEERHPIYIECAKCQIDASGTIEETLEAVRAALVDVP